MSTWHRPADSDPRGSVRAALWVMLWVVVGVTWVAAWFVPWTSRGLLSTSSLADAVRLLRAGSLSSLAPSWAVGLLAVVPACGLVLLASAAWDGPLLAVVRALAVAVMSAVLVAGFHALAQQDPARLGPGGWLTVAGTGLGLVGVLSRLDQLHPSDTRSRR